MRHLGILATLLLAFAPCTVVLAVEEQHSEDGLRPFNEKANANADIDTALAAAMARGTRVLVVLGGNWCHDSRGLAKKFENPDLATLIAAHYELVWVDVGHRDRNMDIPARFGVHGLIGTPSILILSADGELLNADSVHDWRNADSETLAEVYDYFAEWARDE